jgi:branched-chain amino acid transport system substrate-binding protein
MKKRTSWMCTVGTMGFMVIIFLAGICLSPMPRWSIAASEETINVGLLWPLSGAGAAWGIAYTRVQEMKFKEINDSGGWKVGDKIYKFKTWKEDDKYQGSVAAQAASKLVHDIGVKVIFGPNGSSPALALHPITTDAKVPVFCNSYSKKPLGPERKYNFRVCNTSHEYAPVVWSWVKKQYPNVKYIVAIGQNDETGQSETEDIKAACEAVGIKCDIELFEPGQKEFYPLLTRVLAKNPDAMDPTCCALGSAALIMKQARELGFKGQFISSVFLDPNLTAPMSGAEAIEGALTSCPENWVDGSPAEKAFYKKWCDNWDPKEFTASTGVYYTSVEIWLEAIQKVGSTDGEKIRELIESGYLFNTTLYGKVKFGGKDYYGQNHQIKYPIVISQIKNGKLVPVFREK